MSLAELPPRSRPEERERVIVDALLSALQTVPRLEASVERLEAAVLVASGAAARAERVAERLERVIGEHRPNGDERPVSHHDLEELAREMREDNREQANPEIALRALEVAAQATRRASVSARPDAVSVLVKVVGGGVARAARAYITHLAVAVGTMGALWTVAHFAHWLK